MKLVKKPINKYKLGAYISIILFSIAAIIWLFQYNKYHVLLYQEEIQLFRTDYYYFLSYITQPGGLIKYISSFFIQLYHILWLGSVILAVFISLTYIVLYNICNINKDTERFFILPYVLPVLLLMTSANRDFSLGPIIAICFTLSVFWAYIKLTGKYQYIGGFILYFIVYFIAGGNAILFVSLALIYELFKEKRSYFYMLGLIIAGCVIPYLGYTLIYTTTLNKSYFSLTPFDSSYSMIGYYNIAWLSIPVIYLIYHIISKKSTLLEKVKSTKVIIAYFVLIGIFSYLGMNTTTNKYAESLSEMIYATEYADWNKVLEIGSEYDLEIDDPLTIYFTNIALSEQGKLLSDMFHYRQTGSLGLYLGWNINYLIFSYLNELYYRAGVIQEAEHLAYESLVLSPTEHGSKSLRRLIYISMIKGDSANFEKYNRLFRHSPVYKKWAKEQRTYFHIKSANPEFVIPNTPVPAKFDDFVINHGRPEYNFVILLNNDLSNKKAFEYIIATVLLQKDLNSFMAAMDKYYSNLTYNELPQHVEEALIICKYTMKGMEDLIKKYPISKERENQFLEFNKATETVASHMAGQMMKEKYGQTYWYYYLYKNAMMMESAQMASRY